MFFPLDNLIAILCSFSICLWRHSYYGIVFSGPQLPLPLMIRTEHNNNMATGHWLIGRSNNDKVKIKRKVNKRSNNLAQCHLFVEPIVGRLNARWKNEAWENEESSCFLHCYLVVDSKEEEEKKEAELQLHVEYLIVWTARALRPEVIHLDRLLTPR